MCAISPRQLVAIMCFSQVLVQIGAYAWPALLPTFIEAWRLTNSEAGWVTGMFYGAYTLAVPLLVSLTDRIDPKRIYLFGVATTVIAHLSFAFVVEGFWSAIIARALAGIGWAGTYMTGLKLLADRVEGTLMTRAVSGHAAAVGVSGALSYLFADAITKLWGWPAAFLCSGLCALCAWLMIFVVAPWQAKKPKPTQPAPLMDFAPVIKNRAAMAYAIAYCVHTWEMNVLRGWAVAFLAFVAVSDPASEPWMSPAAVTMLAALLGTGASVLGNEASIAFGRVRVIRIATTLCILLAAVIGFIGTFSYTIATALVVAYGILIWLDSSSLTAGTTQSAEPARRGATLAIHSMLGYAGGFVGPLAMGWALDAMGGMSRNAWWVGFATVALVVLAGRIAFEALERAGRLALHERTR
jgi:MFS family permease